MASGRSRLFASSISLDGDRLAVGAPDDYDVDANGNAIPGTDVGAVYVYVRTGSAWSLEAKLRAPGPRPGDRFGSAVDLSHDALLVGAPGDDMVTNPDGTPVAIVGERGACYEFWLVDGFWTYRTRWEPALSAGDAGAGMQFGASVALAGYLNVIAGAPGHRVDGMEDSGSIWMGMPYVEGTPRNKMLPLRTPTGTPISGWRMGTSLAAMFHPSTYKASGSWLSILAGAPGASNSGPGAGAAVYFMGYIAAVGGGRVLVPPGQGAQAAFGTSVSMTTSAGAEVRVVGTPEGPDVVEWNDSGNTLMQVLPAPGEARYGAAVASLADGTVLLGAANANRSRTADAVLAFRRNSDGLWIPTYTLPLAGTNRPGGDGFGSVLSASGTLVAAGAPLWGNLDTPRGYVTIFDTTPEADTDADSLPDCWERDTGLDPASAAGDNGATGDPDADGLTNAQEYAAQSHPHNLASATRYFAEGAARSIGSSGYFATTYAVANPTETTAHVVLRLLFTGGGVESSTFEVAPHATVVRTYTPAGRAASAMEFSAIVESDVAVVTDREMRWPNGTAQGLAAAHTERGIAGPSPTWHFAEGATHSGFDVFYLLANIGDRETRVRGTYLRTSGPPLEKEYVLPAHSRTTIWANFEEFPAGSGRWLVANSEFGATFTSLDSTGFIAERAMYLSRPGTPFVGGHASAGAAATATRWLFAEGATTWTFDEFLLVANPSLTDARVRFTYLLEDGTTFTRDVTVGARARYNAWVDLESFDGGRTYPLGNVSHSTTIESLNDVGVVAERSMWWRSGAWPDGWSEGHDTFGANELGTSWMSALVRTANGDIPCCDYLLVANANDVPVRARLTIPALAPLGEPALSRVDATWVYVLAPHSRLTIPLHDLAPPVGGSFPTSQTNARIDVLGEAAPGVFVEQASYDTAYQAGSCRLLTRLRE